MNTTHFLILSGADVVSKGAVSPDGVAAISHWPKGETDAKQSIIESAKHLHHDSRLHSIGAFDGLYTAQRVSAQRWADYLLSDLEVRHHL